MRILTIATFFFSILCFVGFGLDLFERKMAEILNSREYKKDNRIERDQLHFIVLPLMPGGIKMKDVKRKVMAYMYYVETTAESPPKFFNAPLMECKKSNDVKNNFMNVTSILQGDPEDAFCLPDDFTLPMMGQFGNPNFFLYQFRLLRCVNSTTKNDCLPTEEIDKSLENFFVQFVYMDYYIDLSNYENPFNPMLKSDLLQSFSLSVRIDEYLYKINNLFTDSGWIMESTKFSKSYSYDSRTTFNIGKNPEYMWNTKFTISNIVDVYNRKYIRLQTVFENVGGFLKTILLIFTFINNYFTGNYFIEELFTNSFMK